jgi:hypothetical protein
MLESHQSEEKVAVLMNEVLDMGFTHDEVIDIFNRIDFYHRLEHVDFGNRYQIDFLRYQVLDDAIRIYEKSRGNSFQEDKLFCLLLDGLKSRISRDYILPALTEIEFELYSPELLDSILNNTPLYELVAPFEGLEDGFYIANTEVRLNAFNALSDSIEIIREYDNNFHNEPGQYQRIITRFEYINGNLILIDYDIEDYTFIVFSRELDEDFIEKMPSSSGLKI